LSILQVQGRFLKKGAACEDFQEGIALTQMEVDRAALRSSGKFPIAPLLQHRNVSNAEHTNVDVAKH
jgi:hypothetical protein